MASQLDRPGPGGLICFSQMWPWGSSERLERSERSLWSLTSCYCGTDVVSPPASPKRNRNPQGSAQTLLARGREASGNAVSKGTVEVVRVATTDEVSESEGRIQSSGSLPDQRLDSSNQSPRPRVGIAEDLDNTGNRSVKNSVRWEVEITGSASPKSQKSLEKAERSQKKRKTLHTWLLGFHLAHNSFTIFHIFWALDSYTYALSKTSYFFKQTIISAWLFGLFWDSDCSRRSAEA